MQMHDRFAQISLEPSPLAAFRYTPAIQNNGYGEQH